MGWFESFRDIKNLQVAMSVALLAAGGVCTGYVYIMYDVLASMWASGSIGVISAVLSTTIVYFILVCVLFLAASFGIVVGKAVTGRKID